MEFVDNFSDELVDVICIDDFANNKEYGRERGLNPIPTEAQSRAIDKLQQKINTKVTSVKGKKEDEEEALIFDLKSRPRVILFEATISKRSMNSIMQHTTKRYGYLLNDVLLITSSSSNGKSSIHQIFYLDQISITDLRSIDETEDVNAFEIRTNERPYIFIAESESDKKIWLEELQEAMYCIYASLTNKKAGWFHEIIRGTIHSAAYFGDEKLLAKYIEKYKDTSLDVVDASGMTPLHWATINGHFDTVEMLIEAGCDVDHLNSGLNSPFLLACAYGHKHIVYYLLDHGADIHLRNLKDYDCLLMTIIFGGYHASLYDILEALKIRGVDVNRQDLSGSCPLHEVSSRNLPQSIQALVDVGADVNAKHGRSGLTPLQLACSAEHPDAETVRILLDKGAIPNWRDNNKKSAFDLLLGSQQNPTKAKFSDTSNPKGLKQTVDQVAEFVQNALPSLMELVRKGARFTPESVAHLRDSFQQVLESGREGWKKALEPEYFVEFAISKGESYFSPKNWLPDSASASCLLCLDKFTYGNRRHHCRTCGTLCCDLCSAKRLNLKGVLSGGVSPAKSKNESERVCDSCFNRFVFEAFQWNQSISRAKKELQLRIEEEAKQAASGNSPKGKLSPMNSKSDSAKEVANKTNSANATLNETMRALEERGQKLQETAEKSEMMKEAASDFRQMTKALLKQQQQLAGTR